MISSCASASAARSRRACDLWEIRSYDLKTLSGLWSLPTGTAVELQCHCAWEGHAGAEGRVFLMWEACAAETSGIRRVLSCKVKKMKQLIVYLHLLTQRRKKKEVRQRFRMLILLQRMRSGSRELLKSPRNCHQEKKQLSRCRLQLVADTIKHQEISFWGDLILPGAAAY